MGADQHLLEPCPPFQINVKLPESVCSWYNIILHACCVLKVSKILRVYILVRMYVTNER